MNKRFRFGILSLLALCLFPAGCQSPATGRVRDAHLLWSASPAEREIAEVEQLGPFYEKTVTRDGAVRRSVRPLLWTDIRAADGTTAHTEVLWPLYAREQRAQDTAWRFLWFHGVDRQPQGSTPHDRTWLIPFWFSGTAKDGQSYAALWPLYGTIREMWWDEISFTLFPLWVTWDRGDLHTWSVLWPFVMRQTGPGRDAWRIFPFWGHTVAEGKFEARYVLWPFWVQARHFDRSPGYDWMLWPLVGRVNRASESQWMFLPPFFTFSQGRGKLADYRRINCPWPIVAWYDNDEVHLRRIWPLWGRHWTDDGRATSQWIAWPFWRQRELRLREREVSEWQLFPLFYRSTQVRPVAKDAPANAVPELIEDYLRVWPLYSRRVDPEHRFVRIPDLSFSKRTGALERNLLGMFTLYTRGEDQVRGRVDHEALWGLFRLGGGEKYSASRVWPLWDAQEQDDTWYWNVLGGLLGRSGKGDKAYWRFLWFFGGAPDAPEAPAVPEVSAPEAPAAGQPSAAVQMWVSPLAGTNAPAAKPSEKETAEP